MTEEEKDFLNEGLRRFGEAKQVVDSFLRTARTCVERVVEARADWGPFEPEKLKWTSRSPLSDDPLAADKKGRLAGEKISVRIGIAWDPTSGYDPYCWAQLVDRKSNKPVRTDAMQRFDWADRVRSHPKGLRLDLDLDSLDLPADLELLLDELARFMGEMVPSPDPALQD